MLFHSLDLQFAPDDPRSRDLEVMRERIEHLNKIVGQILNFARSADPILAPVSINSVVEDLGLLVRHKLKQQGIHFESDPDPSGPEALADASQLSQALLNLVLNAIEAMPDGGTLAIKTSREPGGWVAVELSDTGTGMTEEQQAGAFKSLLQTTKKHGTGIGLAIVGKIIDAHGGEIHVRAREGRGTVFTIRLPGPGSG
jgi:signal transduction histidine kinase